MAKINKIKEFNPMTMQNTKKVTKLKNRTCQSIKRVIRGRIISYDEVIGPLHSNFFSCGVISFKTGAVGADERFDPTLGAVERNDPINK